jgi:hypothetical protein
MSSDKTAAYHLRTCLWVMFFLMLTVSPGMAQNPSQELNFPHVVVKTDGENNKISIRSILRITGTTRRTVIEVEVHSDRPFSGGNDTHVLQIGSRKFAWPRGGDATSNTLVFELTPDQFAKLKSGDEIKVTYGSNSPISDESTPSRKIWKFGKLDRSKIDQ